MKRELYLHLGIWNETAYSFDSEQLIDASCSPPRTLGNLANGLLKLFYAGTCHKHKTVWSQDHVILPSNLLLEALRIVVEWLLQRNRNSSGKNRSYTCSGVYPRHQSGNSGCVFGVGNVIFQFKATQVDSYEVLEATLVVDWECIGKTCIKTCSS